MKKEDLEQLVKDLMEMNKYLVKENEELKMNSKDKEKYFWNQLRSGIRAWRG